MTWMISKPIQGLPKQKDPFSAGAETDMVTRSGMSEKQLARMQEELPVKGMPEAVSLPAEVIVGNGMGNLLERLEACNVGDDIAGLRPA